MSATAGETTYKETDIQICFSLAHLRAGNKQIHRKIHELSSKEKERLMESLSDIKIKISGNQMTIPALERI